MLVLNFFSPHLKGVIHIWQLIFLWIILCWYLFGWAHCKGAVSTREDVCNYETIAGVWNNSETMDVLLFTNLIRSSVLLRSLLWCSHNVSVGNSFLRLQFDCVYFKNVKSHLVGDEQEVALMDDSPLHVPADQAHYVQKSRPSYGLSSLMCDTWLKECSKKAMKGCKKTNWWLKWLKYCTIHMQSWWPLLPRALRPAEVAVHLWMSCAQVVHIDQSQTWTPHHPKKLI